MSTSLNSTLLATIQHPASLNALQQYGQACKILRTTTRASNPAWYQDALELNLQLHIRTDGTGISTFYYDRKKAQWSAGPYLTERILQDPARLESVIADALKYARSNRATSLGVILHIADEFATAELKPEFNNPGSLPELREAATLDPASILEDSSILPDQASWRVLPYPAANSGAIGTTVTVSHQYASLFASLREAGDNENFPIVTQALSAPLVAIMGLSQTLEPTPGKPFVAILQYPWFITLACFNEHADLQFIRTLQHRGLRRPTNFRNALATTTVSLEFVDPDLFLVPLGANVDATLADDLESHFPLSRVEVIQQIETEGVPSWSPEPVISAQSATSAEPVTKSHTFTIFQEEKWALQNFLSTPKEIVEMYPRRSEMLLLRWLRWTRVAVITIAALGIAYMGYGMFHMTQSPEWAFDASKATSSKTQLAKLAIEKQKGDHWNNLLEDRSKAWANMESLSRMFPENKGMLVKTYTHAAKPDAAVAAAGKAKPGTSKAGFIKEWKITGYARDEALEYLNTLNTREGIAAHFSEVARITGNSAFNSNIDSRNLVVNIRTQENIRFKAAPLEETSYADESTYPYSFDMTITQRFDATDPMAINTAKAP